MAQRRKLVPCKAAPLLSGGVQIRGRALSGVLQPEPAPDDMPHSKSFFAGVAPADVTPAGAAEPAADPSASSAAKPESTPTPSAVAPSAPPPAALVEAEPSPLSPGASSAAVLSPLSPAASAASEASAATSPSASSADKLKKRGQKRGGDQKAGWGWGVPERQKRERKPKKRDVLEHQKRDVPPKRASRAKPPASFFHLDFYDMMNFIFKTNKKRFLEPRLKQKHTCYVA